MTTCLVFGSCFTRWLPYLTFCSDCTSCIIATVIFRLHLAQSAVPIISRLILQVCVLPTTKMRQGWSRHDTLVFSQHMFDYMGSSTHVFDFLRLFQELFSNYDVHNILQFPVDVVCCLQFKCVVAFVGCALKLYDSTSACFVIERAIRHETDPLSLLRHGFEGHQRSSHLCLSRLNRLWFALSVLGHQDTSTFVPRNRFAQLSNMELQIPTPDER